MDSHESFSNQDSGTIYIYIYLLLFNNNILNFMYKVVRDHRLQHRQGQSKIPRQETCEVDFGVSSIESKPTNETSKQATNQPDRQQHK